MKNVAVFIPCPKSLTEAKVKSFRLILVTKEISKQPSIDPVVWCLVLTVMKINNENQQAEQGKYKMHNLRRMGAEKSGMVLSPVFKERNRLRKARSK